ncbi:hypothetical protein DPMN_044043 [Dreissena polymorpha]|uniref:Uncharacterized protein n=1 Tax=Dreissena polymorpha TaxID=45954 RepID=A0A9D4D3S4_DREPO|nr:hypothetical protein DPMN_044043 [Dreissena polymorpha]
MVLPSGICVHPIGSTSCSMVPSHERRKPGTTLQGGVALALQHLVLGYCTWRSDNCVFTKASVD